MPDFAEAVRPVFFQTDYEEFLYATNGGTLFLVAYKGKVYGVTCRHVFGDFECERLVITRDKFAEKGSKPGYIKGFAYPSSPRDGAIGTDVGDLCVITFGADMTPEFFATPIVIDQTTVGSSRKGDRLIVAGVLKEKSRIVPPDITIGYCRLEFQDDGAHEDPFLRHAIAEFANPAFTEITGISGSPVFDLTSNLLCGMVVRGGMTGRFCQIYFMDAADIAKFLEAVNAGEDRVYYSKLLPR